MLRVLILIDWLRPYGAERVAAELAAGLAKRHEVTIVTFRGSARDSKRWTPADVSHVHLRPRGRRFVRLFSLSVQTTHLLREKRPSAVLSFMPYANSVAAVAGLLARTPVVASEHTIMSLARYGGWERPLLHLAMRAYLRRVAAVIAVSRAVKRDLVERFGASPASVHVIYNPVDSRRLGRDAAAGAPMVTPRLPDERRVVIAASLRWIKGHSWALTALTLLPAAYRLFLVGDGSEEVRLREIVARLGLDGRVAFVGWQDHASAWLADADVVWIPSLAEGFSLVMAEACALGTPVVAAASPGLEEIAQYFGCAMMVDTGNAHALAAATLASDGSRARRPGRLIGQLAPERVAMRYEQVLLSVAPRSRCAAPAPGSAS